MRLCSIASGSSGNCIYVGSEATHLLIDAGISGKRVEAGLNELELTGRDIDAILITHEHADHIAGLGVLARKFGIPIYATAGTIRAMKNCSGTKGVDESLYHEVGEDRKFTVKDLVVNPVRGIGTRRPELLSRSVRFPWSASRCFPALFPSCCLRRPRWDIPIRCCPP